MQILFCKSCGWRAKAGVFMKPVCPNCGSHLHLVEVEEWWEGDCEDFDIHLFKY